MNIFDYITATEVAAYIEKLVSNSIPYFGETLFPRKKQIGTDISWLTGSDGLPIAIEPSNLDAVATVRERTQFGKMGTEMAFFREAMRIGEKDRQQINMLLQNPNSALALPIINKIFDDTMHLVEGVDAQAEIMRMSLLQTGKMQVSGANSGAIYTFDYKMPEANKKKVKAKWTDHENSKPVDDIISTLNDMEDRTGVRPTRLVMNRKTFMDMGASVSIRKDVNPLGYLNITLSDTEALSYMEKKTECKIFVYSKKVAKLGADGLAGETVKLINDDTVVFLPEGTIGNTWYGTTPEESDLLSGATNASCSLVKGGSVAITTIKEPHPVNIKTIVSTMMAPSFEGIKNVAVMDTATVQA